VAQHRHQRHDAGAAAKKEQRAAVRNVPHEMPADRPAQFDGVPDLGHVMEEGRDLAVVEPLDGELDARSLFWRRGDGIAALGLIAVRRGEPDIDMLPGAEGKGGRRREQEALHPGRIGHNRCDLRLLPAELRLARLRGARLSHR
jgi:hypothetical protein